MTPTRFYTLYLLWCMWCGWAVGAWTTVPAVTGWLLVMSVNAALPFAYERAIRS